MATNGSAGFATYRLHRALRPETGVLTWRWRTATPLPDAALHEREHDDSPARVLVALAVTGALLYWGQGRGTKAERLPLLLLICAGIPTIAYFLDAAHAGELRYGGWVFTVGYLVAAAGEVQGLRAAPKISHGG